MPETATEWSVWKDCLYAGDVVIPDKKGRPRRYRFTSNDLRQIQDTNREKIQAGWNVPSCWEHQSVGPQSAGERARDLALGVFARVADYAMTPDGRLKALVKGTDPKDREQFEKVGFVSPEIRQDWRDSTGKVWKGLTITHLAATARPVQPHQNPVGTNPDTIPPRLSGNLADAVRMSCTADASGKSEIVSLSIRLSLENYTGLTRRRYRGSNAMATDSVTESADATGGDATDVANGSAMTWMQRIADTLRDHCGIELGDVKGVKDPDHFAHLIEVAAANYKAGGQPEGDEETPEDEEEDQQAPEGDLTQQPEGSTTPPTPPVQMSIEAQQASNEAALAEQKKELEGIARKNLHHRVNQLEKSGRVTAAKASELRKETDVVRLSFTKEHKLFSNLLTEKIKAREELPVNAAKPPTATPARTKGGKTVKLSQTANDAPPPDSQPTDRSPYHERGEEDTDAIVDAFFKHAGGSGGVED